MAIRDPTVTPLQYKRAITIQKLAGEPDHLKYEKLHFKEYWDGMDIYWELEIGVQITSFEIWTNVLIGII